MSISHVQNWISRLPFRSKMSFISAGAVLATLILVLVPGYFVSRARYTQLNGQRLAAIAASASVAIRGEALRYLNRLSDWLFVIARAVATRLGYPEVLWDQEHT